jgi:hypothetical protein
MHTVLARTLTLGLLGASLTVCAPRLAHAGNDGLACGRRLVSLGDPAALVLDRCGTPDLRSTRTEARFLHGRTYYVAVDEWIYRRGPREFTRVALFENGRLVAIDAIPR